MITLQSCIFECKRVFGLFLSGGNPRLNDISGPEYRASLQVLEPLVQTTTSHRLRCLDWSSPGELSTLVEALLEEHRESLKSESDPFPRLRDGYGCQILLNAALMEMRERKGVWDVNYLKARVQAHKPFSAMDPGFGAILDATNQREIELALAVLDKFPWEVVGVCEPVEVSREIDRDSLGERFERVHRCDSEHLGRAMSELVELYDQHQLLNWRVSLKGVANALQLGFLTMREVSLDYDGLNTYEHFVPTLWREYTTPAWHHYAQVDVKRHLEFVEALVVLDWFIENTDQEEIVRY